MAVSERGGHPVEKKKMRQWYMRITDYAERLLEGLEKVEFSDAMKEMQRNWIGRSTGAEINFRIRIGENMTRKNTYEDSKTQMASLNMTVSEDDEPLVVYTTRPDTIFGVDFMVLCARARPAVNQITTEGQQLSIDEYLTYVKSRSDRERMAEVKQITGAFTGAYAINPFDGKQIPIWSFRVCASRLWHRCNHGGTVR